MLHPIKAAWNRYTTIPAATPFAQSLPPDEIQRNIGSIAASTHPAFRLDTGVYIEIPPSSWGHGDFLVYLPAHNWMVRRNYVEHWYIDIGIFKPFGVNHFGWTDLWLDVVLPRAADHYRILDADELGDALRQNGVSLDNAALALKSLQRLLTTIEQGEFPLPEVRYAEQFYELYQIRTDLSSRNSLPVRNTIHE